MLVGGRGLLKRVFSVVMFILLVTSMLSLAFSIQPVKASGTIYIRADGSIDPPDAPISTVDNVTYTLTGNVTSDADGIVVERDNIVINGAGYTVQGIWSSGTGVDLAGRSNVTIKNTNIEASGYGLYLNSTVDSIISGNNITIYYDGIILESSSNYNSISGNNITANNGKGIMLDGSSNNSISGNNIAHNNDGIYLYSSSSNNSISGNNITHNGNYGIELDASSDNNMVSGNNITNSGYGIMLGFSSDNNMVSGNNITSNSYYGIWLSFSSSNTVSGNNIANNGYGIVLSFSSSNTVSGNNITANNEVGIKLVSSSNNSTYHNNFVANTQQVNSASSANVWDDGYPSGGNYWSDYNGTDANLDGIGDAAYIIDANNTDHYPLMTPHIIPEFPIFLILSLFMIATLLAVTVYRKKHAKISGTP